MPSDQFGRAEAVLATGHFLVPDKRDVADVRMEERGRRWK